MEASMSEQCLRCQVHESTEWTCTCDRDCGHSLCAEKQPRGERHARYAAYVAARTARYAGRDGYEEGWRP